MIEIDAAFVDAEAPNSKAITNGRALVLKGKFVALHKNEENNLLFGECKGSGKKNYFTSADFITPGKVTYRCSCPSRQFPCKHSIGLLYAYVDGETFETANVPEDLAAKREKLAARDAKKTGAKKTDAKAKSAKASKKPKKTNKNALKKKIQAQLDGLETLETLVHDLVRSGMGSMSAKSAREIEKQAKKLGDSYLPGAQNALRTYTKLFSGEDGNFDKADDATKEAIYGKALDQLCNLDALLKRGQAYLSARLEDPELAPETDSPIAAWLGHAWQLGELKEAGLVENDISLMQVAFTSYDDKSRREWVDCGVWVNLGDGRVFNTLNYRPYRAAKYIKEASSFFQVAEVPELCIYPGFLNPRVRWDSMNTRDPEAKDYSQIREHGFDRFDDAVKEVKKQLKTPLSEKQPVLALNFERIGMVDEHFVVEDADGKRLVMTESGIGDEPASCHLITLIPKDLLEKQTLIARFHHDLEARTLRIKPLSIITDSQVFRLTF